MGVACRRGWYPPARLAKPGVAGSRIVVGPHDSRTSQRFRTTVRRIPAIRPRASRKVIAIDRGIPVPARSVVRASTALGTD